MDLCLESPAGDQFWNVSRQYSIFGRIGDQRVAISNPGESAWKPKENIATLSMDSRSLLSSIKLMEETDVCVQTYSFLEVTAVRYDEKPEKMDKDVIFVISWQQGTYCAWQFDWINQLAAQMYRSHDTCSRNITNLFPRKSMTQYTRDLKNTSLKYICETECK